MTIFAAAFFLSLDSFFASIALGAFGIGRGRYARLAIAFGLCDGAASFLGKEFGVSDGRLAWMAPHDITMFTALCLIATVLVLFFAKNKNGPLRYAGIVPVIMGLDNLMNPEFVFSSYASVLVVMLVSSSMSFAGFRLPEQIAPILYKARVSFWGSHAQAHSPVR